MVHMSPAAMGKEFPVYSVFKTEATDNTFLTLPRGKIAMLLVTVPTPPLRRFLERPDVDRCSSYPATATIKVW